MKKPLPTTDDEADAIFAALTAPDDQRVESPQPVDPAKIAAACLLESLAALQAEAFGKAEVIILTVPDDTWTEIVIEQIRPVLYGAKNPSYRNAKKIAVQDERVEIYRGAEISGSQLAYKLSARISAELLSSHSIWIVTEKSVKLHQKLPQEILAVAERELVLPDFTQTAYDNFLGKVTGRPPLTTWTPAPLALLTPAVLRLAARPRQSADDYGRLIARIVAVSEGADACKRATASAAPTPKLSLDHLHGMDDVVAWGKALAIDLDDYKRGQLSWSDLDRGALFYGPPGTGKTTIARVIADHCGVPFIATSYAEWQSTGSGHLGSVTAAIHESFAKARDAAPSVLFIDEIDTINSRFSKKTKHDDWWRAIINTLLEQLDGTTQREGVIVLAATNSPEAIDPAIRRSGRLDRQLRVGYPDAASLTEIYRHHLANALPEIDFTRLGAVSYGLTGADVERFARGARRRARRDRRAVQFADVFGEIAGELPPPGDRSLWSTAIHEAGHAAVMCVLQPARLRLVSILGQEASAGNTISSVLHKRDMNASAVDSELTILMAGRASEELVLGSCMGGCGGPPGSDLALASFLAFAAETSYGLGTTGLLWSELPEMDELHERLASHPEAAMAARARIDQAYERAKVLVAAWRPAIEAIAEALLDYHVLTFEQLIPILTAHRMPMVPVPS